MGKRRFASGRSIGRWCISVALGVALVRIADVGISGHGWSAALPSALPAVPIAPPSTAAGIGGPAAGTGEAVAPHRAAATDGLRVHVPEAIGGGFVIGQLTVQAATTVGFVTAYPCLAGLPRHADGVVARSDLNYDGPVQPLASNRLIARADVNGDLCVWALTNETVTVDVEAVSTAGIVPVPHLRVDTRRGDPVLPGGGVRVHVPAAVGGALLVGQLTVDEATTAGSATAFPCASGPLRDPSGAMVRTDLVYDGPRRPVASNRLIAHADPDGDLCVTTTSPTALIVDIDAVWTSNDVIAVAPQHVELRADRAGSASA